MLRVILVAALVGLGLAGCGRESSYSQETPDDTVRSAVAMVRGGDTARLDDLIYAENDRMRAVLMRLGDLFGRLQGLAAAVQARFPEELAELRTEAADAAAEGRAGDLVFSFGRGRPRPGQEEAMQQAAVALLADPYGWIDRNAARLSTLRLTDDLASLTLDDKPVLPPIGVTLRLDGGRWYFALPTNLPVVSNYMPRSDTEWAIIGSVIKVLDRAVQELTVDVREGRVGSLAALGDRIGEKAIWPGMITFIAYSREMDVRRRRERLERQFEKRERQWAKEREEAGQPVPGRLREAIGLVAAAELDTVARKDKRPNIEAMTAPEFVSYLEGMLASGGLTLSLGSATDEDIGTAVGRWEAARKASKPQKRAR
jgi:hypothetical protein